MIRTRGLAAAFAGGPLIHFPDVDLPQGSVLLLRGPSGSGKSTWLAVVAGLLRPAARLPIPGARATWVFCRKSCTSARP
jgi:putative ABC transport system ATP-binding protein